jgi:Ca-activated chloride channel family protein
MMEKLADKGNGNYAYLDTYAEAKKVLEKESGATLVTVAQDVKFQAEFNPRLVDAYRLIGYENRRLAAQDFNDDTKDAGEVGAGHSVTALYEVIPRGSGEKIPGVDPLKYQKMIPRHDVDAQELMTIKIRYKSPGASKSFKISHHVLDKNIGIEETSRDHRFAAAVAEFGLLLGNSAQRANSRWSHARTLAKGAMGTDPTDEQLELLLLISKAQSLSGG